MVCCLPCCPGPPLLFAPTFFPPLPLSVCSSTPRIKPGPRPFHLPQLCPFCSAPPAVLTSTPTNNPAGTTRTRATTTTPTTSASPTYSPLLPSVPPPNLSSALAYFTSQRDRRKI